MTLFSEQLNKFIANVTWTYAKTMHDWPHEYIVREKVDEELFELLVNTSMFSVEILFRKDHL